VAFGNQSFESGSTSWTNFGTTLVVASDARAGANSMRLSGTGSGTEQVISGLIANKSYTLRGWVKTGSSSDQTYVGVKNFGGAEVNQFTTSTAYTQLTVNFTTGSSNTSAKIFCFKSAGTGNSFCDDFTLTQN
jgi:Carbohydrate binding domain